MYGRFSRSWELAKASLQVLRSDKALVVYPLISTICTILVTISFLVPLSFTGVITRIVTEHSRFAGNSDAVIGLVLTFLFYLVQYFFIIFANAAIVGAVMIVRQGGKPTVADGYRVAFAHVGQIFGYALISATVGMVLRALRSEGNGITRIISGIVISIIGMAWNLATFLVVPVLVIENVGPIEAIKRSAGLLKRTWGEQVIGNVGIGLSSVRSPH